MADSTDPGPERPAANDASRRDRDARQRRIGYQMFGIGWATASEVIAGLLVGWFIDWSFGTGPWGLVAGGVAGVVVGMWSLVRQAIRLQGTNPPPKAVPPSAKQIDGGSE